MPWNLQATTDSPGPAQIGCAAVLALWMTSARQGFDVLHRAITSEWRLLPAEREQPPDLRAHPPGDLEVQLQARIRAAAGCDGQRAASAGPSSELSAVASERSSRLASGTAQSVWASFDLVEAAVHRDRQDGAIANVGAMRASAIARPSRARLRAWPGNRGRRCGRRITRRASPVQSLDAVQRWPFQVGPSRT